MKVKAWLFLILGNLFWAGNLMFGKAVTSDFPPIWASFLRWVIAAVVLIPLAQLVEIVVPSAVAYRAHHYFWHNWHHLFGVIPFHWVIPVLEPGCQGDRARQSKYHDEFDAHFHRNSLCNDRSGTADFPDRRRCYRHYRYAVVGKPNGPDRKNQSVLDANGQNSLTRNTIKSFLIAVKRFRPDIKCCRGEDELMVYVE
ncbi:DMT family transporter [Paenibacillus maysiensis]|uniref:EamA family transporter n=1 Tax=Paenibacillus maysiensis TaxID=1155954 RepID=UPI00046F9983